MPRNAQMAEFPATSRKQIWRPSQIVYRSIYSGTGSLRTSLIRGRCVSRQPAAIFPGIRSFRLFLSNWIAGVWLLYRRMDFLQVLEQIAAIPKLLAVETSVIERQAGEDFLYDETNSASSLPLFGK